MLPKNPFFILMKISSKKQNIYLYVLKVSLSTIIRCWKIFCLLQIFSNNFFWYVLFSKNSNNFHSKGVVYIHSMHTITKHKTACVFSPYLENKHSIIHTTRLIYHLIYLSTTILMVSPLTQASTLRDRYTNHSG